MKKHSLIILAYCYLLQKATSQIWETPTNRQVYGIDQQSLNVTWKLDAQGKEITYASFQRADDQNQPFFTFMSVNAIGATTVYDSQISSSAFGEISFKKLDKSKDKNILVSIDFKDDSTPFTDTMTIQYVDSAPFFTIFLPLATLHVVENTPASKNRAFTIVTKGLLKPTVVWKINGKTIGSNDSFAITETQSQDQLHIVVESKLVIDALQAHHNGILTVTAKYGSEDQISPQAISKMVLDVQYAPKNVTFSTNITNLLIINEAYVGLTCISSSNPSPTYVITESNTVIYEGENQETSVFIDTYHHSKIASFQCRANNTLGLQISNPIKIRILNGTDFSRESEDDNSDWWVYFGVAVGIASVIFIGSAVTLMIIRRRMRSMDIRADVNRVKMRSIRTEEDYQRKAMRHNEPSHVYSLNQRGAPDGNTRSQLHISNSNGNINQGFDVHDDNEAYNIN